jgi:hypothetical protein
MNTLTEDIFLLSILFRGTVRRSTSFAPCAMSFARDAISEMKRSQYLHFMRWPIREMKTGKLHTLSIPNVFNSKILFINSRIFYHDPSVLHFIIHITTTLTMYACDSRFNWNCICFFIRKHYFHQTTTATLLCSSFSFTRMALDGITP